MRAKQTFENEIPDDYSGDELEYFMEESTSDVQKIVLQYIHRMVLFGMIYKENYYNNVDEYITEQILSFL